MRSHSPLLLTSWKYLEEQVDKLGFTRVFAEYYYLGSFLINTFVTGCNPFFLCNPMDCNPPDPSVHGISQARILEWFAISSSRSSSLPRELNLCFLHCKQILYHWAIMEAKHTYMYLLVYQLEGLKTPVETNNWSPDLLLFISLFWLCCTICGILVLCPEFLVPQPGLKLPYTRSFQS